ncbi:MAG: hypothetical protein SGARI_005342 [Bacillariaceae sp.]
MWSVGYGYSRDYDDDCGFSRSGWSEKSAAALRRERQADSLFDQFLKKCSELPLDTSDFPITEEVVKANTHLTGSCYTSFRKRVELKGCRAKKREATIQERKESRDKRKGKLYVISITCPVHPTAAKRKAEKAKFDAEERERLAALRWAKAADAIERKADKEKFDQEERERLAALHRAKVREEYANIVGDDEAAMTHKKASTIEKDATTKVSVKASDILQHAQSLYNNKMDEIRKASREEENELMVDLRRKHAEEETELRNTMSTKRTKKLDEVFEELKRVKQKIEDTFDQENKVN